MITLIGTRVEVKEISQRIYLYLPSCPYFTTVLWIPKPVEPFVATVTGFVKRCEGYIHRYPHPDPNEWKLHHSITFVAVRKSLYSAEILTAYTPEQLQTAISYESFK